MSTVNTYNIDSGDTTSLSIKTNGTTAATVDSSQNVGVGTTTPGSRLTVSAPNADGIRGYDTSDRFNLIGGSSGTANRIAIRGASNPTTPNIITFDTAGSERLRINADGTVQLFTNLVMPYQPSPTSKSAAATLTSAELITGILQYTGAAATITLPTAANIEAAVTWGASNIALDWWVINTGSGTCTIGANGNTTVGALTVTAGASGYFRIRRTAASTFTVYRLS